MKIVINFHYGNLRNALFDVLGNFIALIYYIKKGGDPLLHPDFWEFLEIVKEHDIKFVILGNPFHLTKEVALRLKDYGCVSYQLSIDGIEEIPELVPLIVEAKTKRFGFARVKIL